MLPHTTQKEKLAELQAVCKNNGFIFKKDDSRLLNGKACYLIEHRLTGETFDSLLTIDDSYDKLMSCGYL